MDDLVSASRNLEIQPLILCQLFLSVHTSRNPLFLELNDSVHSVQHALLPRYQSRQSQHLEGGGSIKRRFCLTSARRLGQPILQLRADRGEIRERLGVIEEFAREWKAVLPLDPRSGHEGCGDIPNVHVTEGFGGEGYVRVDEVVRADCCANRGCLARFDDLFWRERSDEQRRADCRDDPFSPKAPKCDVEVDVRVMMLSSGCSLAYSHSAFSARDFDAAYTAIGLGQVTAISSVTSNQSTIVVGRQNLK